MQVRDSIPSARLLRATIFLPSPTARMPLRHTVSVASNSLVRALFGHGYLSHAHAQARRRH
ncbi:MAG: hypothetical protein RMJ83_10410 [Armatimonadota bacterium]|nr:hypothetical protein [Armatimonadota bacterium]